MAVLRFSYQNAQGEVSNRTLTHWSENSRYIQGRSEVDKYPRTYRKDRVLEFFEGAEQLLFDAAPPAPQPSLKASVDTRLQILFTGFDAGLRAELTIKAEEHGLRIVKSPTKSLAILCIGPNAGPAKVEKSREAGAFIVSHDEFIHFLNTGEIPC